MPARFRFDSDRQAFVAVDGLQEYRLSQSLGAGGFGQVYKAQHLPSNRRFALKTLKRGATTDHHDRLRNEARSYGLHRNHPHVLTLIEADLECTPPFLVTELMTATLRAACTSPLPDLGTAYVGCALASALQSIHSMGGFHRDLNPNNVFVGPGPSPEAGPRVVLGDFGLAMEPLLRDSTRTVAGTPGYIAPELARTGYYNAPADIYSLGVTLFEVRTLRDPRQQTSFDLTRHDPAADRDLRQLILDMTLADPTRRPNAGQAAARAGNITQRLLKRHAAGAPQPTPNGAIPEPANDKAVLAILGIGLAAVLLLGE